MLQVHEGAAQIREGAVKAAVCPGAVQTHVNAPISINTGVIGLVALVVLLAVLAPQVAIAAIGALVVGWTGETYLRAQAGHLRPPGEIQRLVDDNRLLREQIEGLAQQVRGLRAQSTAQMSMAHRDYHFTIVRLVDKVSGGMVALEKAANCNDGRPQIDLHVAEQDTRCHWVVVPVGGGMLYQCGVGSVHLMASLPASHEWSHEDYKWSGRRCMDHNNCVKIWEANTGPHQGWLMEHSSGEEGQAQVALRAANKNKYLGVQGKDLVLQSTPHTFEIHLVPLPPSSPGSTDARPSAA